jgi:hypothetical protein
MEIAIDGQAPATAVGGHTLKAVDFLAGVRPASTEYLFTPKDT